MFHSQGWFLLMIDSIFFLLLQNDDHFEDSVEFRNFIYDAFNSSFKIEVYYQDKYKPNEDAII